jgi:hypothetical protein
MRVNDSGKKHYIGKIWNDRFSNKELLMFIEGGSKSNETV